MKVTIKLIGPFAYKLGFSEKEIEVAEEATVEAAISALNLDPSRPRIITRNGRAVVPGERLKEGDRIVISPIYSGG
ncbi:MAG: MoaD/ThiS family protein [Candidatus Aminicenantales bacterium]